jgi:chromate transporter
MNATLWELARIFLKLGLISFGGPAAHIALMEDEFVSRRGWLSRQRFLDLVGAVNLIPGPNSTELAMHIGHERAGWRGLWVGGMCFIAPAVVIVLTLAALYGQFQQQPLLRAIFYGVQPVIIAIVLQALWKLAQTALKDGLTWGIALLALAAAAATGLHEIAILAVAGAVGIALGLQQRSKTDQSTLETEEEPTPEQKMPAVWLMMPFAATSLSWQLFWIFLKIGAILYGSGYVLLAFLRAELVPHYLSDSQLIEAVAIGQMTPGPVFTTATFIGYQIAGTSGALAATAGIFLPSFLFVGLLSLVLDKLAQSSVMRRFLDAVNAASLALMAWVSWLLGRSAIVDVITAIIAVLALGLLLCTKINSAWLIAGGAVFGVLRLWMS